jgi:hypothetical protein
MSLENFRRVDYRLDRANDYIPDNLFAKEGDYDGRELVIQLTNDGTETDTTGVQVIFNWKHLQKGHSGNKYFDEIDLTKGIYKVTYPNEMLFAGYVTSWFTIVDHGKIINTKNNVPLTVEKGETGELIVAENDFTILQQALIQINQYQNEIDTIKQGLIEQIDLFMANKEQQLTTEINQLLAQKEALIDEQVALVEVSRQNIQATDQDLSMQASALINNKTDEIDQMITAKQVLLDDLHSLKEEKLDNLYATEKAELDQLEANYAPQLQAVLSQFNDAMANLTIDSEIITARTSLATGVSYDSLALILQAIENRQLFHDMDTGKEYITTFEVSDGQPRLKIEEVV